MPAKQWRRHVGGTENVKAAGEDGARDAVHDGCVPCYLGLVDGEVRGDGAVETLFDENGVTVCLGHGCCCCLSGGEGGISLVSRFVGELVLVKGTKGDS